jgi:hypothetical protein
MLGAPVKDSKSNNVIGQDRPEAEPKNNIPQFLQHYTFIECLPGIFKDDKLIPYSQQLNSKGSGHGNLDVAYLGACNYSDHQYTNSFSASYPRLIFSSRILLERNDYYANESLINYGSFMEPSEHRSYCSILPDEIQTQKVDVSNYREFCFKNPIEVSKYLVEIWIHPTKKDEVIAYLRDQKVDSKLIDKIVTYENYPTPEQHLADMKAREIAKNKTVGGKTSYAANPNLLLAVQQTSSATAANVVSTASPTPK